MKGPAGMDSDPQVADEELSTIPDSMAAHHAAPHNEFTMDYVGYEPSPGVVHEIDRVSPEINPQEFFDKYVAKRRPVIIKGHLTDPEWRGHRWTNDYLKDHAGHAEVIVEQRGQSKESTFGLAAPKVSMTYGEFIDQVNAGNDRLYLTTQDLERFDEDLDEHDMPRSVMAEPLKSIQEDFSIQPKLVGNLIPYQLSLWQGLAKSGNSSGLHHDYHDNLYILLRGRKRFRLFPPSAASHMRTAGKLAMVHSNGLIVYRNKPDDPTVVVRSDGVPISFLVRQKKDDAEYELGEAEEALEELVGNPNLTAEQKEAERKRLEQRIEECEAKIDEAMDELLVYGCPGDLGSGSDPESEEDSPDINEPQTKRPRLGDAAHQSDSQSHQEHDENPYYQKMPDHFCDMCFPTTSDDPNVVFTSHPHLVSVGCIVCEVAVGDMLYLPASWFHEVTSYSEHTNPKSGDTPGEPNLTTKKCSEDVGHLAFNYWFYPPNGDNFSEPYKHEFWPRRWDRILRGPPLPIQKVWSSDDEEEEGDGEEESEEDV